MTLQMRNTFLEEMHAELHDLCQPLTGLQCRLEIGKMLGRDEALQEAVDASLVETRRIFEVIARIRERLRAEEEDGK